MILVHDPKAIQHIMLKEAEHVPKRVTPSEYAHVHAPSNYILTRFNTSPFAYVATGTF